MANNNIEKQLKEISERLEQGVKEIFTSERYTEYLDTMSKFHNYSFNNTLLITMQKPEATLVAGYQAWQKKFNRHVKRGEKGIQIIAPAPIREKQEIEKIDPVTKEPVIGEDAVYIQILVNQDNKRMVVRKCEENDKDALRWCIEKPDKRKSRKMSNKLFSAMMYDMMGWDTDCRYKILGYKITHEDETMYIFDLTETEIFMDTKRKKKVKAEPAEKNEAVAAPTNQTPEQKAEEVTAKVARKLNRIPFYPKDWQNSFGLPVAEHKKALKTNLADGYIEFSYKKKEKSESRFSGEKGRISYCRNRSDTGAESGRDSSKSGEKVE